MYHLFVSSSFHSTNSCDAERGMADHQVSNLMTEIVAGFKNRKSSVILEDNNWRTVQWSNCHLLDCRSSPQDIPK